MINASELRIGNWINHDTLGVTKVAGITKDADFFAEPIPLTEEILQKCGFTGGYTLSINHGEFWYDKNILSVSYGSQVEEGREVPVKSLHQLQNLYFALTGEELNVSECLK